MGIHSTEDKTSIENVNERTSKLLYSYLEETYKTGSYIFAVIMLLQWIIAVSLAFNTSQDFLKGLTSSVNFNVWLSLILGAVLSGVPITLAVKNPASAFTRHIIAISQMFYSALFIHISGGRMETHYHIFGSLAFLCIFRDWKILITAVTVLISEHFLRGGLWPESIYGKLFAGDWNTFELSLWLLLEVSALIFICGKSTLELAKFAKSQATLESTKLIIEEEVKQRTKDLLDAQENLKRARDDAIQLSKVKSEFLANMSHEIRTPLNGVIGTLDIVLDTKINEEQVDLLTAGYKSAKSLLSIINDVLDVSKIESGKFSISTVHLDMEKFLMDCEKMMSPLAYERHLTLIFHKTESVPKFIVTDEVKLRQVLVNLIGNSIKFTPVGGGILVQVDSKILENNQVEIHFAVSDSGTGISPAKYDLIFEAFSQADNTIARKHGGTGLGLTISKAIVEMMGGKLGLQSKEDIGSTFHFYILAQIGQPEPADIRHETIVKNYVINPDKSNILLAEDNLVNQKITVKLLENRGFKVSVVENGVEVLRALANQKFDLVLMDVQMPVMDGIEAIKQIRSSDQSWSKVPIVALTAHALSGDKENLLAVGADSYVSKPVDKVLFFETIFSFIQD